VKLLSREPCPLLAYCASTWLSSCCFARLSGLRRQCRLVWALLPVFLQISLVYMNKAGQTILGGTVLMWGSFKIGELNTSWSSPLVAQKTQYSFNFFALPASSSLNSGINKLTIQFFLFTAQFFLFTIQFFLFTIQFFLFKI